MYDKKLSEMIWDGSKKRPPTSQGWFNLGPDGKIQTCAIAAAMDDAGLLVQVGKRFRPSSD